MAAKSLICPKCNSKTLNQLRRNKLVVQCGKCGWFRSGPVQVGAVLRGTR